MLLNSHKRVIGSNQEFGQFANSNCKYAEQLQDIIALIAYPNPYDSPLAHYLSQSRREDVARLINERILCTDH
jgi:CTLH/CRA C-terminal to LisH motif domain